MFFGLSPEQEALRDTTRRFLSGLPHARTRLGRGWDRALWAQEAGELGWAAMALPEAYGGFGLGMVEVAVLQEELGRTLHESPYFASCCLAAPVLLAAGSEEQKSAWLPKIAAGEVTATMGWIGHARGFGVGGVGGQATPTDAGYQLDAELLCVVDGATADLLVVACLVEGEVGLFLVPSATSGLRAVAHTTVDGSRSLASVRLAGVQVPESARLPGGKSALERTIDRAGVALAAEQLGVAEVAMEMAVAYAKVRHQFGRPIGSFQAIKHKCADLLVLVESARSVVWYAAAIAEEDGVEPALAASAARSWCTDAVFKVAAENIQIHGGIGFTWECDAHLYFKRAQSSAALLGDASWHREQLATRLDW